MTDPSRLMEGDVAFERAMLGAWSGRQPSDGARQRTLAAVGVAGLALTAAGKASASIAPKAIAASSALLKWLAAGAGVAVVAGALGYASQRTQPDRPTDPATTAVPATVPAATAPTPAPAVPVHTSTAPPGNAPTPQGTALPAPGAVTPKVGVPATSVTSSLDEEVVAIDRARRALTAGDGASALGLLDAYDARYPRGALTQESAELRIDALLRTGRRGDAEKLAERFLGAHPTSPYSRVVRALLAGARPTP